MSTQPLHITGGRKLTAGLAGITATLTVAPGFLISPLAVMPVDTGESLAARLALLGACLTVALVAVLIGQALMRISLGRFRIAGSLRRFFRYQLGALGCGAALGLGFTPAMADAAPAWWVCGITAGLALGAVSLLAFRSTRYPVLPRPPHPHIGLTEGVVVDHWSGSIGRAAAPQMTVICYTDEFGQTRFVRHLVRQSPTVLGTIGQTQFDRKRPELVMRFTNTGQRYSTQSLYAPEQDTVTDGHLGEHF